jgi:hypothetical protein
MVVLRDILEFWPRLDGRGNLQVLFQSRFLA